MAKKEVILALDSGALIAAEKDERVEAAIRKWTREGATIIIPAVVLAEVVRGGPNYTSANRLIAAVDSVSPATNKIGRDAGVRLGKGRNNTLDALVVATAAACGAKDVLTTNPGDIRALADAGVNVIGVPRRIQSKLLSRLHVVEAAVVCDVRPDASCSGSAAAAD